MTTPTEPSSYSLADVTSPAGAPAPHRRRWPWIVAICAALVVFVGAVAVIAYASGRGDNHPQAAAVLTSSSPVSPRVVLPTTLDERSFCIAALDPLQRAADLLLAYQDKKPVDAAAVEKTIEDLQVLEKAAPPALLTPTRDIRSVLTDLDNAILVHPGESGWVNTGLARDSGVAVYGVCAKYATR